VSTAEILIAVKFGMKVCWKSPNYFVTFRPSTGELFITCALNSHMVGVGRWHKPEDFFIQQGGAK